MHPRNQPEKNNTNGPIFTRSELSRDQRLMNLLNIAEADAKNMLQRYETMYSDSTLADNLNLVEALYLTQIKHAKLLREAIYRFTGAYQSAMYPIVPCGENGIDLLKNTFLMEMDNATYYRDLLLSIPDQELRDIFYEILTDKQAHCQILNYLLAKC